MTPRAQITTRTNKIIFHSLLIANFIQRRLNSDLFEFDLLDLLTQKFTTSINKIAFIIYFKNFRLVEVRDEICIQFR